MEIARKYSDEHHQPFLVAVGDNKEYDIISKDRKLKIEVKCETTTLRTGKIAVEYWNSQYNTPSGILATKATLWVHIVPEQGGLIAYEFEIVTLHKLVIEEKNTSSNYRDALFKLISLDKVKKYAKRSFPFNSRFLTEILEVGEAVEDFKKKDPLWDIVDETQGSPSTSNS